MQRSGNTARLGETGSQGFRGSPWVPPSQPLLPATPRPLPLAGPPVFHPPPCLARCEPPFLQKTCPRARDARSPSSAAPHRAGWGGLSPAPGPYGGETNLGLWARPPGRGREGSAAGWSQPGKEQVRREQGSWGREFGAAPDQALQVPGAGHTGPSGLRNCELGL